MAASGRSVLIVCSSDRTRHDARRIIADYLPPHVGVKAGGNKNVISFFNRPGIIHLVIGSTRGDEVQGMEYHDSLGPLTTLMASRVRLDDALTPITKGETP